jgi:hypothetical protein
MRGSRSVVSLGRVSAISAMTRVPELAPFQLMNLANDIYMRRSQIAILVQAKKFGYLTLRDQVSSSQLLKVLAKVGYRVEIGSLKALLKELGFNWNGTACSI